MLPGAEMLLIITLCTPCVPTKFIFVRCTLQLKEKFASLLELIQDKYKATLKLGQKDQSIKIRLS